jgi:ornithine carbamoyltransferase
MRNGLVNTFDLSLQELNGLVSAALAAKKDPGLLSRAMEKKTLVMFFEKPSTRTRLSFEAGMTQMGGHAIYFGKDSQLCAGNEDLADTARVVSRYADAICARVFSHATVEALARHATVPVINALSDRDHPCQALSDVMTIREIYPHKQDVKVAYVGDGNNVCNALMVACALAGFKFAAACPEGYKPDAQYVAFARQHGNAEIYDLPEYAVKNADIVYTDTWVSMGQEKEKQERLKAFAGFAVDAKMMGLAKPSTRFMHCLPAHKGLEVAAEVLEGPQSAVYDQAENRMHAQKALLAWLCGKDLGTKGGARAAVS